MPCLLSSICSRVCCPHWPCCLSTAVITVSHDARLITETNCQLWVVEEKTVNQIEGDFDDYKREVLESLGEVVINKVVKEKDKEWHGLMVNRVPQVGEWRIPPTMDSPGPKKMMRKSVFIPSCCLVIEENANKYLYIGWKELCTLLNDDLVTKGHGVLVLQNSSITCGCSVVHRGRHKNHLKGL